jgi:hypothetical protein
MITIESCPKFNKCSANICPLDPDMLDRVHLPGERVCIYLTEYAKPHARTNLRGSLPDKQFEIITEAYPKIIDRYSSIKKRLSDASKKGSRMVRPPHGEVA